MLNSESMLDYFFKQDFFEIPLYQRSYNWGTGNCETLLSDIFEIHKLSESSGLELKYKNHFFGIVICLRDQYTGDRTIIDGQQRVVSVALLLAAIRDAIIDEQIKPLDDKLSDKIDRKLKDQDEGGVFIKLVEVDKPAYDAIIYRDAIPDEHEKSNIVSNYNYFKKRLLGMKEITLDQFVDCLEGLYIVPIHLNSTHDDAQKVFESINSTGLSLTEGDKIRNYMLMNHSPRDQKNYYNRYWTKMDDGSFDMTLFVRSYLTAITGNVPNMYDVYDDFKNYTKFLRTDEVSFIELFEEMLRYSRYYRHIANSDFNHISDEASSVMFRINYHGPTVVYPFLMKVMDYHESGNISDKEVVDTLKIVEDYILRRALCKISTNSVNYFFSNMFHTLVKDDSGSFTDRFKYALLKREGGARYPRDEEVSYHLCNTDLYLSRTACTHALAVIENANKDTRDTLERISDGKLTMEHVMPQTLSKEWREHLGENHKEIHETWLHRLGNLTLTAYNSKYSNRPYEFKRNLEYTGFRESRLWLNRIMAESDRWTEDVIKERNTLLANRFLKIMPEPTTSYEPPVTIDDSLICYLSDNIDKFYKIQVKGFIFEGERHSAQGGIDAYIQILRMIYDLDPVKFKTVIKQKGEDNLRMELGSDPVRYEKSSLTEIIPGVWTSRSMGNQTKVKFLKEFATSYGIGFDDIAFIATKRR